MKVKYSDSICVIGTGRFGSAVISQLIELGKSVTAVDINEKMLKIFRDQLEDLFVIDATDIKALQAISIDKYETVVVAIGGMINIEIISALLELNVKNIITKARTKRHAKVLKQIGVNIIVNPESEAGTRAALIAANQNFLLYSDKLQELGDNFVIGSTKIKNADIFGKKVRELQFNEFGVTVVLIRRNKMTMRVNGDFILLENDEISLVGTVQNVNLAFKWINTVE